MAITVFCIVIFANVIICEGLSSKVWLFQEANPSFISFMLSSVCKEFPGLSEIYCGSLCGAEDCCTSFIYDEVHKRCSLFSQKPSSVFWSTTSVLYIERCPSSLGYTYDISEDVCYWLSDTAVTWQTANTTCHDNGGTLINIKTNRLREFYKTAILGTVPFFWVDAFDPDGDGNFEWSDGELIDPDFWGKDQPDFIGLMLCGLVHLSPTNITLFNSFCDFPAEFACQYVA